MPVTRSPVRTRVFSTCTCSPDGADVPAGTGRFGIPAVFSERRPGLVKTAVIGASKTFPMRSGPASAARGGAAWKCRYFYSVFRIGDAGLPILSSFSRRGLSVNAASCCRCGSGCFFGICLLRSPLPAPVSECVRPTGVHRPAPGEGGTGMLHEKPPAVAAAGGSRQMNLLLSNASQK